MLTRPAVVPYLLRQKLISKQALVEGDLVVMDASRRNLNYHVISERGPACLLKQGGGPDGIETVRNEANVYKLLWTCAGNRFTCYLPRLFGYDPKEQILAVEFLRDARNLREYYDQQRRFPTGIATALGAALSALHRSNLTKDETEIGSLNLPPPWILSIHRPTLGMLQQLSGAAIQAIKIVQRFPEFCDQLDDLRHDWVNQTLIHFDLKWDNCLIVTPRSGNRKIDLRIVDWELAGVGDPCWDVGSAFHDYLNYWLASIPITGETPPDHFIDLARYPVGKMHPAIRALWRSYVKRMGLAEATSAECLLRAVKYAAVRLLQTVYERLHYSTRLTGNAICSLQVSLNILRRPQEAAVHLLGIPLPIRTMR